MSDNRLVTGADLKRFLDSQGVGGDCPACSTVDSMSIAVNDYERDSDGNAPAILINQVLASNPRLGYGQFVQACLHCGYLRYFRDMEVLAFLEEEGDNHAE